MAEEIVVRSLRDKGIKMDACEVLSISEGRGGAVVGMVAGSADFVRRAKAMGDEFWPYADLQHRKIVFSGRGSIPTTMELETKARLPNHSPEATPGKRTPASPSSPSGAPHL
jgi:hypothetical protein